MSALAERFARARHEKRSGFIPFVLAGDPDLDATAAILAELNRFEPIVIEVGVPFSDPIADGPVIQRAAERAVAAGTTLPGILRMLRRCRSPNLAPLVLFTYFNPIVQLGLEKFARQASAAGVAAVLVVDLPLEAAATLRQQLRPYRIDLILLVAPTTTDARLKQITKVASGFIYVVARTGVTGTVRELTDESREVVARIRAASDLPVAVGFGITNRRQAQRVCRYADAAVVGSRLVGEIERAAAADGFTRERLLRVVRRCGREFA